MTWGSNPVPGDVTPEELAAATRKAKAEYDALDRTGHPVFTKDREAALEAFRKAQQAEADYWQAWWQRAKSDCDWIPRKM